MSSFFSIVAIISFICLILSARKPDTMNKYLKRNFSKKQLMLGFGSLLAISFIIVGLSAPKTYELPQENKQPEETQISPEDQQKELQRQKDLVLAFEKQILETDKTATEAINKMQDGFDKLATGKASIYDVYSLTKDAKTECQNVMLAYQKLVVPDDLPKDVKTHLSKAKSEASTAYFAKTEGLDSALRFLDNQKPSDLQEYKDKIAQSNRFMISASLELAEAKKLVGIN